MDPGILVDGVLRSVLGGRRKRSRSALRYLTRGGGSLWSNPTTLLTAAGVAWGIFETLQNRGSDGLSGVPGSAPASVPPLPNPESRHLRAKRSGEPRRSRAEAGIPDTANDALRMVRLAVSAATADGALNEQERAAVLQQATAAGVADIVEEELRQRRPLAEIVAGVGDPAQRATLYVLAFTILRADEQLTGAERIYLAQLANLMGLDPATVQQLEEDAGERIESLGDQGQLGG